MQSRLYGPLHTANRSLKRVAFASTSLQVLEYMSDSSEAFPLKMAFYMQLIVTHPDPQGLFQDAQWTPATVGSTEPTSSMLPPVRA